MIRNNKGFTLTEILIVMVVAGILLALILPNTLKAIERGNVTAVRNDINSINTALFMCYSEERNWTDCSTLAQLAAVSAAGVPYIDDLPVNPFQASQTPGVGYDTCGDVVSGFRACIDGGLAYPRDIMDDIATGKITTF